MKPSSILILSGGLDSTVSSYIAAKETRPLLALTFDYGQRAAAREREAARRIADRLKVPHRLLGLPWLAEITKTSLVVKNTDLPHPKESELDDPAKGQTSAAAVWVPNRNGLFLNIGAAYAESLGAEVLVTGFNAEEGITFPDNSAPFIQSADEFFWYSTQKKIRVVSYTIAWNKAAIARKARDLGVPLDEIWFCYDGKKEPCRVCESCLRAFRAFREAGIVPVRKN